MPSPTSSSRKRARMIRWIALLAILAFSTIVGLLHQTEKGAAFWPVGVDALCPFGGVEALWAVLIDGYWIQKVAVSSFVLLIATLAVAVIMGRSFCGQICPLGTLQEIFGRLGARFSRRRPQVPMVIDRPARFLKYGVLAFFTVWTWRAGTLVMRPYDPWAAFHHLTSGELMAELGVGAAILGVSVVGSLVYDRFFCKYLCPMGALLGPLAKVSIFKIRRTSVCTECGICNRACPMNIDICESGAVTSAECIACGECVTKCNVDGSIAIQSKRGSKITPLMLTLFTLAVFFGLVGVATAAGWFDWTKPSVASEIRRVQESGGEFDGTAIKGWMSLDNVSESTGIPATELQAEFGVSNADMALPLKDIKDSYGFSMESVRLFVGEEVTGVH